MGNTLTSFADIVEKAKQGPRRKCVLVSGLPGHAVEAIAEAARAGFISPLLLGRREALEGPRTMLSATNAQTVITESDEAALRRAVEIVKEGEADIIMQGSLDQSIFVREALGPKGVSEGNQIPSYVALFELEGKNRLALVTDGYLNDSPSLSAKVMIVENALAVAAALGIERPNVAALASIEQVNPQIPSTLDAAALSKMSERGRFGPARVEGPLDIDCALDRNAARRKGVHSPVAGDCHIYMTPDIESGYALAQLLTFVGRFRVAGIVAGAICPVILNVPFVSEDAALVELALACLLCESIHEKKNP